MHSRGSPRGGVLERNYSVFTGEISDDELARRVYLLFFISLIGIAILIPLGILAVVEKSYALGIFDLTLASVLLINLIHARLYRTYEWNISVGITFTAALFIFAFLTGGSNRTAFVWYYTFPLVSSFTLGTRRGLVLNLAMLLPVIGLFLSSPVPSFLAEYSFDFKVRFVPSYLAVVMFSFLAEYARAKSRDGMIAARDELENRVLERTAALRESNTELEEEIGERKKAEQELSERMNLLALTADIGKALCSIEPLPEMLRDCTDALVEHLDAAFARIWVMNEQSGLLELQASSGMYTHLDGPHSRIRPGELKIGKIAEEGKAVLTNSVVGDPHIRNQEWVLREGMVSFAGHPLHVSGRLAGVMALFARHQLSQSVLDCLASIADQVAVGIDRTQTESKLVYSEEYLRSIVDAEPECVKMLDENGVVIEMNASGLKMLEADSPDQVVGKSLYSLVHPEDSGSVRAFTWKVCRGSGGTLQFRIEGLKGGVRWLETHAVPFEDRRDGRPLVLAVTRDITEAKDAEESLRKVKEDLEKHNEELRKLDEMKNAFIYAVSHELKTPVAKHSMQLEILKPILERYDLSKMEKDSIRIMEESVRRQQVVVRNLLDLSRLESGRRTYRCEDVSLEKLFGLVRKEYEYALQSFGIALDISVPPIMMKTDGEMLWHVLSNVVNNAIKFRRKDVPAHIGVRASVKNGTVLISIRDNGMGLGPADKDKAFNRFYQASTSIEGTGVGLTICKMIVEGLGGRIALESEGQNLGTTVVIELPRGGNGPFHTA